MTARDSRTQKGESTQQAEANPCVWKWDGDEWGEVWWESCNRGDKGFVFETGGPVDNGFAFCPFCGRELREAEQEVAP